MTKNLPTIGLLAICFLLILGCSSVGKITNTIETVQAPKTFTATDNSCQLTAPAMWTSSLDLNPEATIQIASPLNEQYVVIIRESKADFGKKADVAFLANLLRENTKSQLQEASVSEITDATINGLPAKQFEVSGEIQNIKIKYLYNVVATDENFYQIIGWTSFSRFNENRLKLLEVANSFKELNGGAAAKTETDSGKSNSK